MLYFTKIKVDNCDEGVDLSVFLISKLVQTYP
jgi:hypothetical protein